MSKMTHTTTRPFLLLFVSIIAVILCADSAYAVTAPTDTTALLYDFYDIGVEQLLKGPLGFLGGVGVVALSVFIGLKQQWLPALGTFIAGAGLLNADTIVTSMGMLIV